MTQFSDSPAPNADRVHVKPLNVYEAPAQQQATGQAATNQPKVIMYGAQWCGVCKRARAYFHRNKIRYVEYDVEKSARGKNDYRRMKGSGVPIFLVDGRRVDGFTEARFDTLLGSAP